MNRKKTVILIQEIFYAASAAVVVFYILEIIWPGVVFSRLDLDLVLLFWLLIGIVLLALNSKE
jgi:hypothetical protein